MMKESKRCHLCGGPMLPGTARWCKSLPERTVVFENVPALICQQCGETVFPDAVVKEIEAIIVNKPEPDRVIEAAAYSLRPARYTASKP